MKHFSWIAAATVVALLVSLLPISLRADDYDKKTIITLSQPTEVPGIVLQPGTYVIKLLNSSSNRHIAEIMNEKMDHLYALTFTAAAEKVKQTGKTVLTFYEGSQGRPQAMRKWFWPGTRSGRSLYIPSPRRPRFRLARKRRSPKETCRLLRKVASPWYLTT